MRVDGRDAAQLRPITITRGYTKYAEGSVLIEMGETKVLCTASVEDRVPPFLVGTGRGWVTAEYSMLPRATQTRNSRDIQKLKLNGRSGEIQRLIGRSLRAAVDLSALGERSILIDCDVLQADGGTRCASIVGGYVALVDALRTLELETMPLRFEMAAVSVGKIDGTPMLDLCYQEDSHAEVDMNFVMNADGAIIEVQGTAEGAVFSKAELDALYDLAYRGTQDIIAQVKGALS